jgi:cytochrome c2
LHCHFERSIKPEPKPWSKIEWEEDEIKEFEENPKKYIKTILELQNKIGYDFFDKKDVDEKEIEELLVLTKLKKKAKKWWKKQCK